MLPHTFMKTILLNSFPAFNGASPKYFVCCGHDILCRSTGICGCLCHYQKPSDVTHVGSVVVVVIVGRTFLGQGVQPVSKVSKISKSQ